MLLVLFHNPEHFVGAINFYSKHNWSAFLGLKYSRLFGWNVQNTEVSGRVLHKRNVNTCREVLVKLKQFVLQNPCFFVFGCLLHLSEVS